MTTEQMKKAHNTLVHKTIPRDVGNEWKYYAQYQQLIHGEYDDAKSTHLEEMLEQCQERTNAALRQANTLHRALAERKVRVPVIPKYHRPRIV